MSELNPMAPQEKSPPAAASVLVQASQNSLTQAALLLSALALGGVAWLAWDAQNRDEALHQAAGRSDALSIQNALLLKHLQDQLADSQNHSTQLEAKLAEIQTQRIALEEMYRELARAPDDWLLAEIEQTLNIAAQQLQLAGNVRAAVIALQSADARLARSDKLQTVQLRRAINQDLDRLKALPLVDATGISIKLDNLINLVDSLPLVIAETSSTTRAQDRARNAADEGWMTRIARDAWDEFRQLLRIRQIESNELALLTPSQSYFLRENLKLRLLSARHALLARDEASYKEDLGQARDWVNRYFDPKAKVNAATSATLKQLFEGAINISVPDINASMNAVRAARAAREKSPR
jgi:uroporphyrin-III C-methyltransferase